MLTHSTSFRSVPGCELFLHHCCWVKVFSRLWLNYCLCLIISEQLTFYPSYVNSSVYYTGSEKQLEGAELRYSKAPLLCTVNGPKCSISFKRSPLPNVPHLIIQTAEFWRARARGRSCISDHRSSWKWCGLHARSPPPPLRVLSPILISRGASWRGSRTAVQLAARSPSFHLQRLTPPCLSACLPACVRHK